MYKQSVVYPCNRKYPAVKEKQNIDPQATDIQNRCAKSKKSDTHTNNVCVHL